MVRTQTANGDGWKVFFPFSPKEFGDLFSDVLNRNRTLTESLLSATNQEMLRFIGHRIERNGDAIEICRECKTYPELLAAQQKWFTEAYREYFAECLRLGETVQSALLESAPSGARPRPEGMRTKEPEKTPAEPARLRA